MLTCWICFINCYYRLFLLCKIALVVLYATAVCINGLFHRPAVLNAMIFIFHHIGWCDESLWTKSWIFLWAGDCLWCLLLIQLTILLIQLRRHIVLLVILRVRHRAVAFHAYYFLEFPLLIYAFQLLLLRSVFNSAHCLLYRGK